ncbi:MAG: hypothetical protein V4773_16935 [Verrucomicrobiota bacterium]
MNNADLISLRSASIGQPLPAFEPREPARRVATDDSARADLEQLLSDLTGAESAIYAITREGLHDAAERKFARLHALLDENFLDLGIRLTRLAARSRELGCEPYTGHGDRVPAQRKRVEESEREPSMIRELLGGHEAMSGKLRTASAASADRFRDRATAELLADLASQHERDAFMLRALLWEVQSNPS